ncbi:MAG: hypothetical protein IJZ70_04590 [Bacteroidales bacterium]|nr:hypothetical protein [Bacteroidales bacterium]
MIRFLFALMLLVFAGCSRNDVKVVDSAEATDTLFMKSTSLSQELLMPARMMITDGRLVFFQITGDDVFVLLDNPLSGKCRTIGRRGRGPGEFMEVDIQSLKSTDDGFLCMDAGGYKKEVTITGDEVKVVSMQIPTFGHPQNGILIDGDVYISANVMNDESEYILYYGNETEPSFVSEYPEWTHDQSQPSAFVYMKNMVSHPTKELMASFYVYFRKLRILRTDGDVLHDIDVRVPDEFPSYSAEVHNRSFAYASYPVATDKYIYALCRNAYKGDLINADTEIHVWTWDGELKKRIILDRPLDLFAVDEVNSMIYGCKVSESSTLYYQSF